MSTEKQTPAEGAALDPALVERAARELAAAFESVFYPGWDHLNHFDRKLYLRYATRMLAKVGPGLYEQGRLAGADEEAAAAAERAHIAAKPPQSISYPYGISPNASLAAVDRAIIPAGGSHGTAS